MNEPIRLSFADMAYLAPELTLVITTIVLILLDLLLPRRVDRALIGWLAVLGTIISAVLVCFQLNPEEPVAILGNSYRIDDFGNIIKLILLGSTALITLMSLGSVDSEEIPHTGEYYYLLLPATLGGMIMASSGDLITLFVGLEVLSITSYILVGMRKKNLLSNEGAFKYIVLGGISSAIILYGMSFLYGVTGSTDLAIISTAIVEQASVALPLIYVAYFLMLAGLGFKIAAAPFHAWAPDVYQGAPTPIAAFLAVVSKGAGFALLFKLLYGTIGMEAVKTMFSSPSSTEMADFTKDLSIALMVMAALAMVIGNATALRQTNVKRLLALSGVANAGYLLVPIAVQFGLLHYSNFSEFAFYLVAYALMNIGLFTVLTFLENSGGKGELSDFAGLYYRAPFTASAVIILVLSLTGIPITAGFFGKLYILMGSMQTHDYWLAAVMLVTSVISFYYYFGLIRQMFMRSGDSQDKIQTRLPGLIVLWICVGLTVILGIMPHWVFKFIESIFTLQKDLFML